MSQVIEKWEKVKNPQKNNMSKKERNAIKELKQDKSLIVKKADKGGGATVVMDRQRYVEEAQGQLNDDKVYRKLTHDPTFEIKKLIDETLDVACDSGIIPPEIKSALKNDNPIVPLLYMVPKIHKDLTRPPGRPIVSGVNSVLEPIAIYVDGYLQKITKKLSNSLKDTGNFLSRI